MKVEKIFKVSLYTGDINEIEINTFLTNRVKSIESDGDDNQYAATIVVEEV